MAAEVLLCATGIDAARGGKPVLHAISVNLAAHEVLAVLGPNGAGKSSLLRVLVGLAPYHGSVRVAGTELRELSARERAKHLGFVPQASALNAALPVWDVVEQGRFAHRSGLRPSTRDARAVESALELSDCTDLATRRFTELSLGEQRRVLIARALASEARILCLDEPAAAFDVGHALRLYRLLRELAQRGYAIAIVLHQLQDALLHADRALLLDQGRTVCEGPVAEVVSERPIRAVYGVELERGTGLTFRLPQGPS